jgi:hypothetical protein
MVALVRLAHDRPGQALLAAVTTVLLAAVWAVGCPSLPAAAAEARASRAEVDAAAQDARSALHGDGHRHGRAGSDQKRGQGLSAGTCADMPPATGPAGAPLETSADAPPAPAPRAGALAAVGAAASPPPADRTPVSDGVLLRV